MNLALGTLAATLAFSSTGASAPATAPGAELEYPLPVLRGPCLDTPCGGSVLTDLVLVLDEPGGPSAGEVRGRVGDDYYLGARADETTRGLFFSTARWDVEVDHADDRARLGAEYRGRRLRVGIDAFDYRSDTGDGLRLDVEAAYRLGPDLEIVVGALEDDRTGPHAGTVPRPTSSLSLGALWQHGARLELGASVETGTVETPGGLELDRRALGVDGAFEADRWSVSGGLALDELSGRIDRREATAEARFGYRVIPHLVATAEVRERYDLDLGSIGNGSELGLTYHVRSFNFARTGAAARRTVELTRRAYELGFNERRPADDAGRRRLRQRLELSRAAAELAPLIDRLHRAQIDERDVPIAGFTLRRARDEVEGSRFRETEVFLAVPWSRRDGPHPLRQDEAATDFLRFTYARSERDISRGFTTEGQRLAIDLALRRELTLGFSWEEPAPTGLEFALRTQQPRRFLARLVYRRGI